MYGIIVCSECKRKRMIDLGCDRTKCPHCGHGADTKNVNILYKDEDQSRVRAVYSSMTGFVSEKMVKLEDTDPMSTLAFRVEHISDIGLKLKAVCDGLSEIKGTFTLDDVEEIVPGKGEKFIKIMLDECMIYEVSLGKYRK